MQSGHIVFTNFRSFIMNFVEITSRRFLQKTIKTIIAQNLKVYLKL